MTFETWLAFLITASLISASPGPNMLHMLSSGTRYGFKATLNTMYGCFFAVLLMNVACMIGLGAILHASPTAFTIIRYLGAAYLVYLGVRSWYSTEAVVDFEIDVGTREPIGKRNIFWKGFLVGISNPKAFLFFTAFFPQFINADKPQYPQFAVLMVTFAVIEFFCYSCYALGGTTLARLLNNSHRRRVLNKIIGAIFVGFGILVLFYKP